MASSFGSRARGGALKSPAIALFLAALFAALPAQARRKKVKPPEPPPQTATPEAAPTPEPTPAPAGPSSVPREAVPEPVTGPSLTVVGIALDPTRTRDAALDGFLGEQAVRRARKQPLAPLADLLDPTAAAAREKAAVDAKRALDSARKAYFNDLDLDTAGALCDKAYGLYLKSDVPQHFEELVAASELKIASLAGDPSKADRARTELSLLLPIDPRTELSPNLFNPDLLKIAEAMRSQLKGQSTLSLAITTGSVPARVFLDGTFRGIAPVTIDHLPPGNHLLTVVAPGYARVQRKVNPGPEPTLDVALEPAELASAIRPRIDGLARVFLSPALPKALAELASALKVEQVLVLAAEAGPTPGSSQAAAVRGTGTALKPVLLADLDVPAPSDGLKRVSAVDALATQAVSSDRVLHGHREVLSGGGGSGGGARIAGYGLIGAGAVGAGVGAFFGLAAKSHQSDFRNLAQTDPAAASLASSGKTDALIANVAIGAAVVAVVTGVALVLTHSSGKAADESDASDGEAPPPPRAVEPEPARRPEVARPAETKKPVVAKPAESKKPEPTKPAETKKPEVAKPAESKKPEPTKPAETKKPEVAKPAESKKPEPTKPAESKKPEPTKPAESKKPEPTKPAEPRTEGTTPASPDAGAPNPKKPPHDLGEDIKD
jgi:outer membrane biosynthesis protein TonB